MELGRAGKVTATVAATVATLFVANQAIAGSLMGTPNAIKAEYVLGKYKYFQHENKGKEINKAVADFVKAPRKSKLIAKKETIKEGDKNVTTWTYEFISGDDWENEQDKKDKKTEWKTLNALQDWDAVDQYLKDQNAKSTNEGEGAKENKSQGETESTEGADKDGSGSTQSELVVVKEQKDTVPSDLNGGKQE